MSSKNAWLWYGRRFLYVIIVQGKVWLRYFDDQKKISYKKKSLITSPDLVWLYPAMGEIDRKLTILRWFRVGIWDAKTFISDQKTYDLVGSLVELELLSEQMESFEEADQAWQLQSQLLGQKIWCDGSWQRTFSGRWVKFWFPSGRALQQRTVIEKVKLSFTDPCAPNQYFFHFALNEFFLHLFKIHVFQAANENDNTLSKKTIIFNGNFYGPFFLFLGQY